MRVGKRSISAKKYDAAMIVQKSIDLESRALAMILHIQEVVGDKTGVTARMDCPFCGGVKTVAYSVARNGHIHSACSKRCFGFMQ